MPMSTRRRARLSTTIRFAALAFAGTASVAATSAHAQALPQDAYSSAQTCAVTQPQITGWFGGTITPNGAVSPASSVTFPTNNTNCDFYQWSSQMFLWLTGPAGNVSPWVFDSPIFYSVSPADANGNRVLTQQGWGLAQTASFRTAQAGPNGLPVVIDKTGQLREVLHTPVGKGGVSLVPNAKGALVPVASVKIGANNAASLLDVKGQTIQAKPNLSAIMLPKMVLQRAGLSAAPSPAAKTQLLAKLTASHVLLQIQSANGKQQFVDSAT